MPSLPPHYCLTPRCPNRTPKGYCASCMTKRYGEKELIRGSRHARGYGSKWDKLRIRVLKRDNYACVPCRKDGIITSATEVDHIKPKQLGGLDIMINLQSICHNCHAAKTTKERCNG